MIRYVLHRLLHMVPVLIGVTVIVFFVVRVSGDPVALMLPEDATQEQVEQLTRALGLDRPLPEQYLRYLVGLTRVEFGVSLRYPNRSALAVTLERLPATLQLSAAALLVALAIAIPAGIAAATHRNRWPDRLASSLSVLGEALPSFWLGIMLIMLFSVQLGWLPVSGRGGLAHLVLPAVTLGLGLAALLTRLMRSSLIQALDEDYVRTATAKGVPRRQVVTKHALRTALLPFVTVLGLQFASLLAGAVVTEHVFAWPGIGRLAIQAIHTRDMAIIQAVVMVAAIVVMVANLVIDVAYTVIDPRIEYA